MGAGALPSVAGDRCQFNLEADMRHVHWNLQSKEFFSSPNEQKEKCMISVDNKGWMMQSETLDPKNHRRPDFKE